MTSASMVMGMVRLMATVAMRDDVRKQPQSHKASETTVPSRPFKRRRRSWSRDGHSNVSSSLKCRKKNSGQSRSKLNKPTNPEIITL